MQTQRASYNYSLHSQRGVATIFAVMMMLSLLAFLAVVTDTGRLYLEKRTLQKNADLAALETALLYCRDQTMDSTAMDAAALNVLSRNNFQGTSGDGGNSTVTVTQSGKAVTVNLAYSVRASLFGQLLSNGFVNLSARATAKACEPTAQLAMRSSLVSVDSSQSELLNAVLGGLLNTSIDLDIGEWNALLNTNINLLNYLIELGATAGNYQAVLDTPISISQLVSVAATVLNKEGSLLSIEGSDALTELLSFSIPATPITLGSLITIPENASDASIDASINVFNLIQGTILLAGGNSAVELNQTVNVLGLTNGKVGVKITQPPQFSAIGNPEEDEIKVRTAQVQLFISLSTFLPLISSVVPILSQIDVLVTAGNAKGQVTDYDCKSPPASLSSTVSTSAAQIQIGKLGNTPTAAYNAFENGNLNFTHTPIAEIKVSVPLVGVVPIVSIGLKADTSIAGGSAPVNHEKSPSIEYLPEINDPMEENAFIQAGNLTDLLSLNVDLKTTILNSSLLYLVNALINGIVNSLTSMLNGVLSALLLPIVNPLLSSLGVDIASADLGAALTCENDKVRLTN